MDLEIQTFVTALIDIQCKLPKVIIPAVSGFNFSE